MAACARLINFAFALALFTSAASGQSKPDTTTSSDLMDVELSRVTVTAMGGRNLSEDRVVELENQLQSNPEDLEARALLLGYYFFNRLNSPANRQAHLSHVLWVIEHHPESALAGATVTTIDGISVPDAYQRGRELWLAHCKVQPDNVAILDHAASFFTIYDRPKAIELMMAAQKLQPENARWARRLGQLFMLGRGEGQDVESARKALEQFERALEKTTDLNRFYMLADVAKSALFAGEREKARQYATELLEMSLEVGKDWNYGNAVHHGNLVLGHLALQEGKIEEAEQCLLKAGKTPGSPQLNSFGPNMLLAKNLLEAGRKEAVLEYFDLCGKFWKAGNIALWKKAVEEGRMPDFGANLRY